MTSSTPDPLAPSRPERRPAAALAGKQRRHLRALAHGLSPLVRVGQEGVSEGLLEATRAALETHELIKVKLLEGAPLGRDDAGEALASGCGAHVAGAVGRVLILYRRHPEKPRITLPR